MDIVNKDINKIDIIFLCFDIFNMKPINKKIKSHSISTKDPHPSSIAFGSLSRS